MSDQAVSTGTFDFADLMSLGSLDTSDLSAQISRLAKQGIYVVDLHKPVIAAQAPADPADPMNFTIAMAGDIMHFTPLTPEVGDDEVTGKVLNDRYFLYGKQMREAIQLLMGRAKVAGFRYKGILGGVEGSAPGWLDEMTGKRVVVRVSWYTPKDGQERARFDWLSVKQLEKLGISWEVMGRQFLDETGQPQEPGFYEKKKQAA